LLLGFCSFTLAFIWLVAQRYRLAGLEAKEESFGLELALAERRLEGGR
jgi:hypothetical protein